MGDENEDTRECEAMRKIFVGGLNKSTTEEPFLSYFSQFGNTVDSVITVSYTHLTLPTKA